jgi:hypothetical protein
MSWMAAGHDGSAASLVAAAKTMLVPRATGPG